MGSLVWSVFVRVCLRHGGANEGGSASAPAWGSMFEPHYMYAAGFDEVVVVTVQYRLGLFGFLGSPDLQAETSDGSAGNFGLQDQRMALRWVQEQIQVMRKTNICCAILY